MADGLYLPGLNGPAQAPIEEFAGLVYVENRELFSQQLVSAEQPLLEVQDLIDDFDPSHPGIPILDEVPPQAEEAVELIRDDMSRTFKQGSYVLRVLFRQGDVSHSADPNFDLPHRDFEGNCLATYVVSDETPTIARVAGKKTAGDPYQIVRMRGDVLHYRPRKVSDTRTTVITNITDRRVFDAINGGSFAGLARAAGVLRPARYL